MANSKIRQSLKRWQKEQLLRKCKRIDGVGEMGGTSIVFAPHQDDETLGCGGIIQRRVDAGYRVAVVYLTDGSSSHSQFIAGPELVEMRKSEALSACQTLGIPEDQVGFLNYPDGNLHGVSESAQIDVQSILAKEKPDEIFVPYRYDLTPDHIAANEIVQQAIAGIPKNYIVYEYPIWYWFHWPQVSLKGLDQYLLKMWAKNTIRTRLGMNSYTEFNAVCDIRDHLSNKRAALEKHRSQTVKLDGIPEWPVLSEVANGEFLPLFFQGLEYFYRYEKTV